MQSITVLLTLVWALLATPLASWGLRDTIEPWERMPAEGGRQLGPIPDERFQGDAVRGLGGDHFGERRGPWPQGQEISSPEGWALRATGNLARARNDLNENGAVFAALARFGANPSPLGVAKILDLMEAYPVEFWGLADRVRGAARGEGPSAWRGLYEAVRLFREARVMEDGDWDHLAYVLVRLSQGESPERDPEGQGNPIFHRPFDAAEGIPAGTGGGKGGQDGGDSTDGWFGGRFGPKSPVGEIGPVTDPGKWGKGRGGMGDGIMGWSNGEQGPPKGSRWAPHVDVGVKPDFHGPRTMGPDGGFYGGIDIGMFPGQAAGDGKDDDMPETVRTALFRQWQYLKDKAEQSKGIMKEMLQAMADILENRLTGKINDVNEFIVQGGESTLVIGSQGYTYWHDHSSGKVWEIVWGPVTVVTPPRQGGGGGKLPNPEGEGDQSPINDPQLLLRMTKAADKAQNKPDVVPGVIDPVPIRGSDAAGRAGGGELAAAGAAKAEAAWRFAGKKPGSEVTDPAEWQTFRGEETSGIARDVSLITDPAEPLAGAVAMGERSSGVSGEMHKPLFDQFMGQFLVQSIKAGATQ